MNQRALWSATFIALVLQLAMLVVEHRDPFVREHYFASYGSVVAGFAGVFYAGLARPKLAYGALGGLIAGGVGALVTIAAAAALHDVIPEVLAFGGVAAAMAGAVGGLIGSLIFRAAR